MTDPTNDAHSPLLRFDGTAGELILNSDTIALLHADQAVIDAATRWHATRDDPHPKNREDAEFGLYQATAALAALRSGRANG